MKKLLLTSSLLLAHSAFAITNGELLEQIQSLKSDIQTMKVEQEEQTSALLDEIANSSSNTNDSATKYESFSSLGVAASKVYHSDDSVSLGGYGEYSFTKYTDYKNYSDDTSNKTRKKSELNVVRFVPYIGFKYDDWIVMNTEIEFEDGGARSDDTKNYKYAIVEFSYLDFLIKEEFALRVGHILVPFGQVNLNHEPVAYLTTDRPAVETFIIPSTWHTNGLLTHGTLGDVEYYAGVISSPDAGGFGEVEGRFIQQGRLGARAFSDDFSFVTRASYTPLNALETGISLLYGTSTVLEQIRPGISSSHTSDAKINIKMAEAHASYKGSGFNVQALATYGSFSNDVAQLETDLNAKIADSVNGAYLTFGYDLLHTFNATQKLYIVSEIEYLNMDVSNRTSIPDNNKFSEYTLGFSYFPADKVVLKSDYKITDYRSNASLSDEAVLNFSAGFIF